MTSHYRPTDDTSTALPRRGERSLWQGAPRRLLGRKFGPPGEYRAERAAAAQARAGDLPLPAETGFYGRFGKRALEVGLVLFALPVALPLMVVIGLIVMLDGALPLYRQTRLGRGGREFTMWKFRTMVPAADDKLEEHLLCSPDMRAEWNATQKLKSDPRTTAVGRFLRKYSLDELPQLFNVLRGDMSLIGPRPMLPRQRPLYRGGDGFRLRPGITGYWQVSERNEDRFDVRANYDAVYEQSLSLRTDLWIILRTVVVMFRGTGY